MIVDCSHHAIPICFVFWLGNMCYRKIVSLYHMSSMLLQAKPNVGPIITQTVMANVSKVHDDTAVASEISSTQLRPTHLCHAGGDEAVKVVGRRVKGKVSKAIANAMKQWDDECQPQTLTF